MSDDRSPLDEIDSLRTENARLVKLQAVLITAIHHKIDRQLPPEEIIRQYLLRTDATEVEVRVARCRHLWTHIGRAPDFNGMRCEMWRCEECNKTWELFEGIKP